MFETIKTNLEAKGFAVSCFANSADAVAYMCSQIKGQKVAFGGSSTVNQIGLYEALGEENNVVWHWRLKDGDTWDGNLLAARDADVYIASANGISETGEIVNIDGAGNRVAETLFGHKKIYFVVGKNKIAPDLMGAIDRAKNVAAPKNAERLHKEVKNVARAIVIMEQPMNSAEYEVVLIDEELGF